MATNGKLTPAQLAAELDKLINADLNGVMAILAIRLEDIRKSDDGPKVIAANQTGATALRLAANHWMIRKNGASDPLAAYRAAAAK